MFSKIKESLSNASKKAKAMLDKTITVSKTVVPIVLGLVGISVLASVAATATSVVVTVAASVLTVVVGIALIAFIATDKLATDMLHIIQVITSITSMFKSMRQ